MTSVILLDMFLELTPIARCDTMMEAFQYFSREPSIPATGNDRHEPFHQREHQETFLGDSKRRELFTSNRRLSIGRRKRVDEALEMLDRIRGTTWTSSPGRGCGGCHLIGGTGLMRLYKKMPHHGERRRGQIWQVM
jgi:hypothetical protein